ncbi:anti-anti-sigma factor [Bordetella genomosp. 8]|uniref:Anti-sigma factor antagonist n=1 Tax=Bordetella genomosp. 8 TaxID=1416806 RepID=A0A1W6YTZ0_9BORD|nr:STAS domain-containing protein [Bordetella genomosp. 8]ARP84556.1 anti-anti-sigma factor [Bordetella genomosp. 8]
MTLAIEKVGPALVVSPQGQLNSANAASVESELLRQIDNGENKVVLDLSSLDYISSAGLRVMLLAAKRLKQKGGALALCSIQPHVREVFDISGFLSILTVVDARDDALDLMA